jgi:uncharacterized membrane protein YkgB
VLRLVNGGLGIIASSNSNRFGIGAMKIAIAIIFLWIGFLKFQPYDADTITPFVASSPVMSFFYEHPKEYKPHLTSEGELKPSQRDWQAANNTYGFSNGFGTLELVIGGLTLAGLFSRRLWLVGAAMAFATPFVTPSFLITTPKAWVPAWAMCSTASLISRGPGGWSSRTSPS